MEDLFSWLSGTNSSIVITSLLMITIITALVKSQTIIDIFKWISNKKTVRSCGDCILILFGIREKHEAEIEMIEKNILRSQMNYFEQRESEIIQTITASFRDDIERFGKDSPEPLKIAQINNYQEAFKNSLREVKDVLRQSFKENGFTNYNDNDYTSYVKSKAKSFISMVQSYLMTYCTNVEPIVSLKNRFEKFDHSGIESTAFDVYNNARTVYKKSNEQIQKLKNQFVIDINTFVENPRKR